MNKLKLKKLLTFLICLTLIASVLMLAACNKNDDNNGSSDDETKASPSFSNGNFASYTVPSTDNGYPYAPGNFSGFWSFINSPISVLIILALQLFHIFAGIKANAKSSNVFYKEIKNLASQNRLYSYYSQMVNNYEAAAEIRIFDETPLIKKSWLNHIIHPVYVTNILHFNALLMRIQTCVSFIMDLTLYLYIGAKAYMGAFGIGNFVLYTGTIEKFISAVTNLSNIFSALKNNNIYLREIFEYIDMPNTMYQGTLPVEKRAFCDGGDNDYEIEFRDVSFKYPASETYALRHVSVKFRIGERLAVVGMNGSGKTTFVKLLCRFNQTQIPLVDKVRKTQTLILVLFCNRYHETKVCPSQFLQSPLIPFPDSLGKLNFLFNRNQILLTNLLQVLVKRSTLSVRYRFCYL